MTDLDHILAENKAPAPRSNLADRILAAAEVTTPANDEAAHRPWWRHSVVRGGGIAAMAVMAAMFFMQPETAVDTDWVQIADASGFSDLYDWVEGDEG